MTIIIPLWLVIVILIVLISPKQPQENKEICSIEEFQENLSWSKSKNDIFVRIYYWIMCGVILFCLPGMFELGVTATLSFIVTIACILGLPFALAHYILNKVSK